MPTITLRPTSNVHSYLYGTGYDVVDEDPANDADYNYCDTSGTSQYDIYGWQDPPSELSPTVINSVKIYGRTQKVGTLIAGWVSFGFHIGSAFYWSTGRRGSTYWTLYSDTWTTNPSTGVAWTWTDITNLQAGVLLQGGYIETEDVYAKCSQLYVVVTYTPVSIEITGSITTATSLNGNNAIKKPLYSTSVSANNNLTNVSVTYARKQFQSVLLSATSNLYTALYNLRVNRSIQSTFSTSTNLGTIASSPKIKRSLQSTFSTSTNLNTIASSPKIKRSLQSTFSTSTNLVTILGDPLVRRPLKVSAVSTTSTITTGVGEPRRFIRSPTLSTLSTLLTARLSTKKLEGSINASFYLNGYIRTNRRTTGTVTSYPDSLCASRSTQKCSGSVSFGANTTIKYQMGNWVRVFGNPIGAVNNVTGIATKSQGVNGNITINTHLIEHDEIHGLRHRLNSTITPAPSLSAFLRTTTKIAGGVGIGQDISAVYHVMRRFFVSDLLLTSDLNAKLEKYGWLIGKVSAHSHITGKIKGTWRITGDIPTVIIVNKGDMRKASLMTCYLTGTNITPEIKIHTRQDANFDIEIELDHALNTTQTQECIKGHTVSICFHLSGEIINFCGTVTVCSIRTGHTRLVIENASATITRG